MMNDEDAIYNFSTDMKEYWLANLFVTTMLLVAVCTLCVYLCLKNTVDLTVFHSRES